MRVIIAGGRDITDEKCVGTAIANSGFKITKVVSGGARGVDELGELFARLMGLPVIRFTADWIGLGKSAGPIRNGKMAEYADALIAIWDGQSRGTKNMIATMRKLKKPVYVHLVR